MKMLLSLILLVIATSSFALDSRCSTTVYQQAPSEKALINFAKRATVNAYNWHFDAVDKELASLQGCFTTTGWQSFNQALLRSQTLKTIKEKSLVSKAQLSGDITVKTVNKDKEWQITLPLSVHYENEKKELTQKLMVTVAIVYNQKQLGIEQVTVKQG